jgi:hypothetical protein
MLEEHVKLGGREGMEVILQRSDEGTDGLEGPANVTAWAAARNPCSMVYSSLPLVIWTLRAFPPHPTLRPSYELVRREIAILRRMPFCCQAGVCGGEAIGFHHGESSTGGTAGTQSGSAGDRGLPLMVIGHRAFPPHLPRAGSDDVVGCERTIFRGVPLLRQIGVCGSQAIGFHCLDILTARAPALHVSSADDLRFPLVVVREGTFPPDFPATTSSNVPGS